MRSEAIPSGAVLTWPHNASAAGSVGRLHAEAETWPRTAAGRRRILTGGRS